MESSKDREDKKIENKILENENYTKNERNKIENKILNI